VFRCSGQLFLQQLNGSFSSTRGANCAEKPRGHGELINREPSGPGEDDKQAAQTNASRTRRSVRAARMDPRPMRGNRERLLRCDEFVAVDVAVGSGVPVRFLNMRSLDGPSLPACTTRFLNDRFGDRASCNWTQAYVGSALRPVDQSLTR
jgi:hypothetical protein